MPATANRQAAVDGHEKLAHITPTDWAGGSIPSKYEERMLSIVCGNTSLKWAIHQGADGDFLPILFWSTPAPSRDETETGDPCSVLERHLPPGGHELIFGTRGAPADKVHAAKAAADRRVPILSVYVVSTNQDNENGVEAMFKDIPCRMYRLKGSDFFSVEDGAYKGMGIDRLSNMRAAMKFYGSPLLVIDGGTAMTYTGLNAKGRIIGGGICPGISAVTRSMHDYTGGLPLISQEDIEKAASDASNNKDPLPIFANDTKTAMIATTLKAKKDICWGAVNAFKQLVLADKEEAAKEAAAIASLAADGAATESEKVTDGSGDRLFTICCTGGDMNMISSLLTADHSSMVPSDLGPNALDGIEINKHRNLCHYGVGTVLSEKQKETAAVETDDDLVRAEILGQRVAKQFNLNGAKKIFRGTVAAAAAGKGLEDDWFYVRYDDGDAEHLSITGLYDALSLFNEIGEEDPAAAEGEKVKKKMADSKEIATMLVSKSAIVKKHSETPVAERKGSESKKRGPLGTPTKGPPNKVAKTKSFSNKVDPHSYVNSRVSKMFGEETYYGTITKYIAAPTAKDDHLWHVLYDDDDSEDFDAKDLKKALALYKQKCKGDKKARVQDRVQEHSEVEAEVIAEVAGDDAPPAEAPALGESVPIAMEVDAAPYDAEAAPAPGVDV